MKVPNPLMTVLNTFDVTNLLRMDDCIGRAASRTSEFYVLPIGEKLFRCDRPAVNTIVKNKRGENSSCDLRNAW